MRERWTSRFGFIMATAGFAIGLGNIWRFPYVTGANGGGAFLLVYILLAACIGIPLFTAEIALGRRAQLTPIAGMRRLTGRATSPWNLIGWLGIATAFLILSYYQLILGWILAWLVKAGAGGFRGASSPEIEAAFGAFVSDTGAVLLCGGAMLLLTGIVVSRGLRGGVERVATLLMPLLLLLLIALAAGALLLPGAGEGLRWFLAPDFSELTPAAVLAALGQVFYSIGVGMAGAFAFGSYLDPRSSDVPGNAALVVAFDTVAAVLAGLVIFPALFAFGLAPGAGPGLLFVTMPNLFAIAPGGWLVGVAFFFLVLIAGLTSVLAVVETLTASLMDALGIGRRRALWPLLAAVFLAGTPVALGFGPWSGVRFMGADIFGVVDFVASNVLVIIGGLMIALYTGWVWPFSEFRRETNIGAGRVRVAAWWRPLVLFMIPLAVTFVLLSGLGLLP